jgi:hypothetical protein
MEKKMKLNDEVIAHISKLVQLAIISGTDVVDHFRMIRLTPSENELFLEENYRSQIDDNIKKMVNEVNNKLK